MELPKVKCIFCQDRNAKCHHCNGGEAKRLLTISKQPKKIDVYDPVLPDMVTAKAILANGHLPMIDNAEFVDGKLVLTIQNLYDTFSVLKIVSIENKICFLNEKDEIIPWG